MRATLALLGALVVAVIPLLASAAEPLAPTSVDFERQVVLILVRRCIGCHNASDPAGGLNLTERGSALAGGESQEPAIVPRDPAASRLLARIRSQEMPPEGKGQPVTPSELAQLEAWITAGAAWPEGRVLSPFEFTSDVRAGRDWWSLQPPVRHQPPVIKRADLVRNPIDAFVIAELEAKELQPNPEADKATLIRRAMLDLVGLPPAPEEIEAFLNDQQSDAYERLIDRLLASPGYGERWARHWLDVVRFGESNGYETNTARGNAWPYRDWVIRALNDDMPYPEFVMRQLAGDQLGDDAATGYLVGGAHDVVGSPDIELTLQQRVNDLDDIVSTTSTAFLGLTAGCAKCHDHKFDPITQRDYYALQAIFAGVEHGERELRTSSSEQRRQEEHRVRDELRRVQHEIEYLAANGQPLAQTGTSSPMRSAVNARLNVDRFSPMNARYVRFSILATNQFEPCIDELEVFAADSPRDLALASEGAKGSASSVFASGGSELHKLEHVNDGRYGNARSWISAERDAGWVQIELPESATLERVHWGRDREGQFNDRIATRYKIELSQTGEDWVVVSSSDDRKPFDPRAKTADTLPIDGLPPKTAEAIDRLQSEAERLKQQLAKLMPPQVYAGTFKRAPATHILYRGEPLQKREEAMPGGIAAVGVFQNLADETPEHERRKALAEWIGSSSNPLTARVIVNRLWHHHFGTGVIKSPSDFGFQAGLPSHPELLDWLASEFVAGGWQLKSLHRLIMLSATYRQSSRTNPQAAALDAQNRLLWRFSPRRLEAEAIRDRILATSGMLDVRMGGPGYDAFEPNGNYVKVYTPKEKFGPAEWRRMVYQNKPRMRQDGIFGEFDCPDASQTMARRNISTTALQALNLLNGSFVIEQSREFAERLQRDSGQNPEQQAHRAFMLAFGRAPDDQELAAGQQLIAEQGLIVFCRALFNANEFLYLN